MMKVPDKTTKIRSEPGVEGLPSETSPIELIVKIAQLLSETIAVLNIIKRPVGVEK